MRIPPEVLHLTIGGYTLAPLGTHGLGHWGRVLENGLEYHVREKRCWKSVASTFEEARAKSGVSA